MTYIIPRGRVKSRPIRAEGNVERIEREESNAAEARWWLSQMGELK